MQGLADGGSEEPDAATGEHAVDEGSHHVVAGVREHPQGLDVHRPVGGVGPPHVAEDLGQRRQIGGIGELPDHDALGGAGAVRLCA